MISNLLSHIASPPIPHPPTALSRRFDPTIDFPGYDDPPSIPSPVEMYIAVNGAEWAYASDEYTIGLCRSYCTDVVRSARAMLQADDDIITFADIGCNAYTIHGIRKAANYVRPGCPAEMEGVVDHIIAMCEE